MLRFLAFALCLLGAVASAGGSPRALKPGEGMMVVQVTHVSRYFVPTTARNRFERLTVWDFQKKEWRKIESRCYGDSDCLFFGVLAEGKYELGGVTYTVNNGQMIITFELPLTGAKPSFTVVGGRLSELGSVLFESGEQVDPSALNPTFPVRATRGPPLDPMAVRSLAVSYPKLADALRQPAGTWDRVDAGRELWDEFKTRVGPVGPPSRDEDGALLIPLRVGMLMRVPTSGSPEIIETGSSSGHRRVERVPGFGYLMLTEYGGLRQAKALDGPWQEIALPGDDVLGATDAIVVGDSLIVAVTEGIDWSSSLFSEGVFKPSRAAILKRDGAGSWTRIAQAALAGETAFAALSPTRAAVLSGEQLTSIDLATGETTSRKLEADALRGFRDGSFIAYETDAPFDSRQHYSRDGLKWVQVADKHFPYEARFSHTVAVEGGRYAFLGRAKVRGTSPLDLFVLDGKGRGGKDEYKVAGRVPAGCGYFPWLNSLGDDVFVYCAVTPRVHWISLKDGSTKEVR